MVSARPVPALSVTSGSFESALLTPKLTTAMAPILSTVGLTETSPAIAGGVESPLPASGGLYGSSDMQAHAPIANAATMAAQRNLMRRSGQKVIRSIPQAPAGGHSAASHG